MDMAFWKNLIQDRGGMDNVAQFIFDNSRYHTMDPTRPVDDQVTLDEANDAWIFEHKDQPVSVNGRNIAEIHVEANESLQSIVFVKNVKDKPYFRKDI